MLLDPLQASAIPRELTVTAANAAKPESNGEIRLKNILVGEVWFCGGQSNMEYPVAVTSAGAGPATANDPKLELQVERLKTTGTASVKRA